MWAGNLYLGPFEITEWIRESVPQQKRRLGAISKNITRWLKSTLRGHNPLISVAVYKFNK